MTSETIRYDRPASDELHPLVYQALIGLALWLILSVWAFFNDWGYAELLLAVVSGFILIVVAVPGAIWLTWRRHRDPSPARPRHDSNFRDWASGDFNIWQSRISGTEAAIQILLPIAAVALGMTAFGISLHIAANG